MSNILVTGGCGFIGSNFIRMLIQNEWEGKIINLDKLTYAARPHFLADIKANSNSYIFHEGDINDFELVRNIVQTYKPKYVVHFAAESHVCNSIKGPRLFYETNVMGTVNLLEVIRQYSIGTRFVHVSTDEVFGELPLDANLKFSETTPVAPRSPYSSSKAASDHAVQAYHYTYGLNTVITNCSNNYGPNQHEEKLIPKTIKSIALKEPMTVHGSGLNRRDWIAVEDHCVGILKAMFSSEPGDRFCFGGNWEIPNLEMIEIIHSIIRDRIGINNPLKIKHTDDRPTDDARYSVDYSKAKRELGYHPKPISQRWEYLEKTIVWYLDQYLDLSDYFKKSDYLENRA